MRRAITNLEISAPEVMIKVTANSKPEPPDKTRSDRDPTLREIVQETSLSSRLKNANTLTKMSPDLAVAALELDPTPLRETLTLRMLARPSSLSVELARTPTKAIYVKFSSASER